MPEELPQRVLSESCGSALAQAELPTAIGLPLGMGGAQRYPSSSPSCPGGHVGKGKMKLHLFYIPSL